MSTNRTNELGNAILKALDISPDWAGELTLHSVPGELETVTVVFHAWNPDTSEMTRTTRTWREVEEPTDA